MSDLSVVLIQIDSLSRHFLRCYGNDWVRTPNLDAFARRAAVFDQHYTGSLPCMPARREIWCGVEELWWRGWGPLEPWDEPIAHCCRRSGRWWLEPGRGGRGGGRVEVLLGRHRMGLGDRNVQFGDRGRHANGCVVIVVGE